MKVVATPGIRGAYEELVPQFEKQSGQRVSTSWIGTAELRKRLHAGDFDAILAPTDLIDELDEKAGLMAGSRVDVARSGIGIAVRAGLAKPDVSSAAALKRALLAATAVSISTGPSGVYLTGLFERMGLREALKPKLRVPPSGGMVAELLANGTAEIGLQQTSELVNAPGIQYLGPLPAELQHVTRFAGAAHATASDPQAARALVRFLAEPGHAPVWQRHGLESAVTRQ